MLIQNSKIFRASVLDKMECESEERLVMTLPASLPARTRNSLVGGSSGKCQIVATDTVCPKLAASFSQNTSVRQHHISENFRITTGAA